MSYDIIKLNYEQAEHMAQTFNQSAQQLKQVQDEIKKLGTQMTEGAFQGSAGQKFVELINGAFSQSMNKLIEKCNELEKDVKGAIQDMKNADKESAGFFS